MTNIESSKTYKRVISILPTITPINVLTNINVLLNDIIFTCVIVLLKFVFIIAQYAFKFKF